MAAVQQQSLLYRQSLPDAQWFREQLHQLGYAWPEGKGFNLALRNTIAALQMKYRPALADGVADAKTAAILSVLNQRK